MSVALARWPARMEWVLNDEPSRLDLPAWVHVVVVTNIGIPVLLATYIYGGPVLLAIVGTTFVAAFAAWLGTTYARPASRRVLPVYVGTVVGVHLHALEQWTQGYAEALVQLFPAAFQDPVVFGEMMWLAAFPLGGTALFLAGGVGLYYHHRLGNFLAWLLFSYAIVIGVSHFVLGFLAPVGFVYVPGMLLAVVPVALGVVGAYSLFRFRIER